MKNGSYDLIMHVEAAQTYRRLSCARQAYGSLCYVERPLAKYGHCGGKKERKRGREREMSCFIVWFSLVSGK
jgi:hypothetical protein